MMESNSELKIENNMEPKPTYTRKEKFNDSFFIRKSIIAHSINDDANHDRMRQQSIEPGALCH